MKVVIAGGSGLIGRRVASALASQENEVVVLSRQPSNHLRLASKGVTLKGWNPADETGTWARELRGAGAVINLAGASVGAWPWTPSRMRSLVDSRLAATTAIVNALATIPTSDRPPVLINASGTDLYEGNDLEPADESSPPTDTFLARLCADWEAAAQRAEASGTRVVIARMSLVMDQDASALARFALPVRLFAGGRLGSGKQWISWIYSSDVVGLMLLMLSRSDISGPINFASPDPRQQADFSRTLARILHRPFWLPTPAFAIRLALGKQATLALGSRRVSPAKAIELGYLFEQPTLDGALTAALRPTS